MDELKREFYGMAEIANYLGVSKETIRKLIKDGELNASRVRTKYIIKKEDIEKYSEKQKLK